MKCWKTVKTAGSDGLEQMPFPGILARRKEGRQTQRLQDNHRRACRHVETDRDEVNLVFFSPLVICKVICHRNSTSHPDAFGPDSRLGLQAVPNHLAQEDRQTQEKSNPRLDHQLKTSPSQASSFSCFFSKPALNSSIAEMQRTSHQQFHNRRRKTQKGTHIKRNQHQFFPDWSMESLQTWVLFF